MKSRDYYPFKPKQLRQLVFLPLLLLCGMTMFGQQIVTTLNVDPNPTPDFLEWASNPQTVFGTATNITNNTLNFKIKATITREGEMLAQTDLRKMPVETIGPGETVTKFAEDVIPFDAVTLGSSGIELQILQTGQFPAGNYIICMELVDATNPDISLSIEQCRPFLLTDYQPPILITPANGFSLPTNIPIQFSWTPVTPNYFRMVNYRLIIVELLKKQNALIALRYNYPLVDQEVLNLNQLLLTPDLFEPESGKTYVWTVQALDSETGKPIGDAEGFAEPFSFSTETLGGNSKKIAANCPSFAGFSFMGPTELDNPDIWALTNFTFETNIYQLNSSTDPVPEWDFYIKQHRLYDEENNLEVIGGKNISFAYPGEFNGVKVNLCAELTFGRKKHFGGQIDEAFSCTKFKCETITLKKKKEKEGQPLPQVSEICPSFTDFSFLGPTKKVNPNIWELTNFTFEHNIYQLNSSTNPIPEWDYFIKQHRLYDEESNLEVIEGVDISFSYPGDWEDVKVNLCAELTFGRKKHYGGKVDKDFSCTRFICKEISLGNPPEEEDSGLPDCEFDADIAIERKGCDKRTYTDVTVLPSEAEVISRVWTIDGEEINPFVVTTDGGEEEEEAPSGGNQRTIMDEDVGKTLHSFFEEDGEEEVCLILTIKNGDNPACIAKKCLTVNDCATSALDADFSMTSLGMRTKKFKDVSSYADGFTIQFRKWTVNGEEVEPDDDIMENDDQEEAENSGGNNSVDKRLRISDIKRNFSDYVGGSRLTYEFPELGEYELCLEVMVKNPEGITCCQKECRIVNIRQLCDVQEETVSCDPISTKTYRTNDAILLHGNMEMILTEDPTGSNNSLSGKGKVNFPWLGTEVAVDFSGISVNAQNRLCSGEIWSIKDPGAPTYPEQWGINIAYEVTEDLIIGVDNGVKNEGYNVDVLGEAQEQVEPVKVPLGLNNANGYTLAFTGFQFTPDDNQFSALMSVPFDYYDDHTLGFKATNLSFNAGGPVSPFGQGGSGGIELIGDKTIYYGAFGERLSLTFKPPVDGNGGTAIKWEVDCNEVDGVTVDWCLYVEIDFTFPRKWLLPLDKNDPSQVKANLQTDVCNFEDWIIELDLERCIINNTNGLELEVQTMAFDHSDIRNAEGMVFPSEYDQYGDTEVTFRGFYLKQLKVVLPEQFSTFSDPDERVEFDLNNWVIAKHAGISGDLLVEPVLGYQDVNVADLKASIDKIEVKIRQSSLMTAEMNGQILLPVTDEDQENALDYTALFGTGNFGSYDGFQFILSPDGDLETPLFANGNLSIDESSKLEILLNSNDKEFDLELHGTLDFPDVEINNPVNGIDPEKIPLNMETHFQGLSLNYKQSVGDIDFSPGTWSLASDQKKLFRFPVTIENFQKTTETKEGNELFRGGVSFDAVVNLMQDKIGGQTNLGLVGAIEKPAGGPMRARFKQVKLNQVRVFADVAAVKLDGSLDFYSNDPTYGNGIQAEIDAQFKCIEMKVEADARFGNKPSSNNAEERFRYWKAGLLFSGLDPGIPFLPGLAFKGFGGGASYHMMKDPNADYSDEDVFIPDENTGLAFKATAIIATTPDERAFNTDVSLEAEFWSGPDGGLKFIGFDGDFWMGETIAKRNDAFGEGFVEVDYFFADKIFHLGAGLSFEKDPISTPSPATFNFHIDGKKNEWYFKAGDPANGVYNSVQVAGVGVQNYIMFGNNIAAPTGFMQSTIDGLNEAASAGESSVYTGSISSSAVVNADTQKGKGFAFGIAAGADIEESYHIAGRLTAEYNFEAGAEFNMSLFQFQGGCNGYYPIGMNGWYVQGGLALYASGQAGIRIARKCGTLSNPCLFYCCKKYPDGKYFHLLSIGLGAWVTGGFPKPLYLQGGLFVSYNILNKVEGSFHASFQVGNQCNLSSPVASTETFEQQEATDELVQLIRHVNPQNSSTDVSQNITLRAGLGFEPGEAFDVAEQQEDGTVEYRTFKVDYNIRLEKGFTGNWEEIPFESKKGLLGDFLIYHNSPDPSADVPTSAFESQTGYRLIIDAQLKEKETATSPWTNVSGFQETSISRFRTGGILDSDEGSNNNSG